MDMSYEAMHLRLDEADAQLRDGKPDDAMRTLLAVVRALIPLTAEEVRHPPV